MSMNCRAKAAHVERILLNAYGIGPLTIFHVLSALEGIGLVSIAVDYFPAASDLFTYFYQLFYHRSWNRNPLAPVLVHPTNMYM